MSATTETMPEGLRELVEDLRDELYGSQFGDPAAGAAEGRSVADKIERAWLEFCGIDLPSRQAAVLDSWLTNMSTRAHENIGRLREEA